MTDRDRKRESGDILEHMPLEEIRIEDIRYMEPPEEWTPELHEREPYVPPVLIEEIDSHGEEEDLYTSGPGRFSLLAHHRSFWRTRAKGHLSIKALVVRSSVHITLAHQSITNCTEEALLFEGLLRNELVENRSRLSDMLGYSRARITQILNLLKLPVEIRGKLLLTDDISEFQLRPLVRITEPDQQMEAFGKLIEGKLTGRQMALFASGKQEDEPVEAPVEKAPDLEEMISDAPDLGKTEERPVSPAPPIPEKRRPTVAESGASPVANTRRIAQTLAKLGSLRDPGWEMKARQMALGEVDIMLLRGISMLRSGLYEQAIEMLEIVIENDSGMAPAYFFIGRAFNLTGNHEAAEGYLRTALELVPDHPDYIVELAIVLEKLKRHSEASSFYKRAGAIRKKQVESGE